MREGFVPLAAMLRSPRVAERAARETPARVAGGAVPASVASVDGALAELVADLARLRLAAFEAYERGVARLLAALADDVLARELRLAPVDVAVLAERAIAAFANEEPIEIVVARCDADALRAMTTLPIRIDPLLAAGDVSVVVRDGSFESPLAVRLASALADACDA